LKRKPTYLFSQNVKISIFSRKFANFRFAKIRKLSFRENFRLCESYSEHFRFRESFPEKFSVCAKVSEEIFRFRERYRENCVEEISVILNTIEVTHYRQQTNKPDNNPNENKR
jgi:hypothetical protein